MNKCLYCLTALVLVVFALGLDFGAKNQFSKSMMLRARSLTVPVERKGPMKVEAARISRRGSFVAAAGLVLAVSSLACLVNSFRRHEPARWRSVAVALLLCYLMMQFMLV